MVQSLNTKVDLVVKGTSFLGLNDYGQLMVGDRAFEFYDERQAMNFIQIPWEEVDYVIVQILFKGQWIPRFAIQTKKNGTFSFAAKDPKRVLRAIRKYIPADRIVQSLGFFAVIKRAIMGWLGKNK